MPQTISTSPIQMRRFGWSEAQVSALGFGGHHLGDAENAESAQRLVREAIDGGITFLDNCWEYHRGKSEVCGAAETLVQAKKQGKVRFVGFTGHKDPSIHLKMLATGFPFDSIRMPLNPFDGQFRSFEQRVLPELHRRGIAALGMKPLQGYGDAIQKGRAEPGGIPSLRHEFAVNYHDHRDRQARGIAAKLTKTTKKYDGDIGREQHGFPSAATPPA